MIKTCSVNEDKLLELSNEKKTEVYDLSKPLEENTIVVQEEKKNILHQMDLNAVIQNLDNTVDLLNVSYHAVYGFPVQTQIFGLQKRVMDLNDDGIVVITEFKNKSGAIVTELNSVFKWLVKGAETVAIGKLEKFADVAAGMSSQADEMAKGYEDAAAETSEVLQDVMDANAKQYEKNDQMQTKLNDLQAKLEVADTVQASVSERLASLKKEYERLSKAEESEMKMQNTQAIIGMVMGSLQGVADLAGRFLGKQASSGNASDANHISGIQRNFGNAAKGAAVSNQKLKQDIANQESVVQKLTDEIDSISKHKDETQAELDSKCAEEKTIQNGELSEDEKAEKGKEIENQIQVCRDQIRKLNSELEEKQKEKKTAEEKLTNLKNELGDAAQDGTGSTQGAAESQQKDQGQSEAAVRGERMQAIFDEMIKLEEKKTEQLALLAKYTKEMESVVIDKNAMEAAIQSLIIAISCLKRTVVALKDIALFWKSLESSCRALSNNTLKDTIKDLQSLDKEERIEYYYSEDVMYPLLSYMAQWSSIMYICGDYLDAAEKTRQNLNKTLIESENTASIDRTEHWDKASKLAGQVGSRIDKQVKESNKKIEDIRIKNK